MTNMKKPNMDLLKTLTEQAAKVKQEDVCKQFFGMAHHQTAFVFEFDGDFPTMDLTSGEGGNAIGERMIRLIETLNTPISIKADVFTRTLNNGTLNGIFPGIEIAGEPMSPEEFLAKGKWVLTCYVRANKDF